MNDFKKNLREYNIKHVDEKIQHVLGEKLSKLEAMTDVKAYKHHISERKSGILEILNNFDFFISILDVKIKLVPLEKKKKDINYKYTLDNIIKKLIVEELDLLYKNASLSTSNNATNTSIQIFDRKMKIAELLDNYDDYMKFIQAYLEEEKNSDCEQLIH